ncbi:hypothetical protein [Chryseobacterium rhizosphaerae]|uniref:hypothetical protein n=1 Tax=Chryseobacterium rhizosphaerae TaxID=395937 RepID=UPI00119578E2|nr:hypothetical protein [Chryseobacterium rhizosphaerae]GEN69574.1 hypothetical protein CRH01_41420 [Chryseobacterium rhizosphaerae]
MKNKIIFVIILLFSLSIFGQNSKPGDEYAEAREIIKDLDSIVSPNGIQERYKVNIGVFSNGFLCVVSIKIIR